MPTARIEREAMGIAAISHSSCSSERIVSLELSLPARCVGSVGVRLPPVCIVRTGMHDERNVVLTTLVTLLNLILLPGQGTIS